MPTMHRLRARPLNVRVACHNIELDGFMQASRMHIVSAAALRILSLRHSVTCRH